jgi:hypothetical protein
VPGKPDRQILFDRLTAAWCNVRASGTLMITSYLVLLAATCYLLKIMPGVVQTIGYLFGLLVATWSVDEYFRRS